MKFLDKIKNGASSFAASFSSFFKKKDGSARKHPWFWGVSAFLLFVLLFIFSVLGSLRIFFPYLPEITGLPFSSKNYLFVFQNNHELRPGGGFISAYGIAHFQNGILTKLDVSDVYGDIDNHAYIEPPYPMKELLQNEWYKGYTFRDANYNPDFPATAAELTRMLHITKPDQQVDGVITVNYSFLEDLLGATGPVEVNGKMFSQNSLFEMLEDQVNNVDKHNVDQLKNRKSILKPFADALIKKIAFSPFKLRRVADTIVHSLATKEIQLYFNSPNLEKMVQEQGWGGNWPDQINTDFLAVNEANLGGMKSDRYLQRQVTDNVTMKENSEGTFDLVSDVRIHIYHYGSENVPLNGPYTGYIRTYVPKGAKLLAVSADYKNGLHEEDQGLFHIFGNVVKLQPGEDTEIRYQYSLPAKVDKNYHLYIPKQSGTREDYYTVLVQAPQGFLVNSDQFEQKENIGVYQQELSNDVDLSLNISADKTPPRVIYQGLDQLGKIDIEFNTDVSNSSAEDPLNYGVADLNLTHPEVTDQLQIDHIEHSGKGVKLFVKGMTAQPEESYGVTLKNISDLHGNIIDPNPKMITAVQRIK